MVSVKKKPIPGEGKMTIQAKVSGFIPRNYEIFAGLDVDKKSMAVAFTDHQESTRLWSGNRLGLPGRRTAISGSSSDLV